MREDKTNPLKTSVIVNPKNERLPLPAIEIYLSKNHTDVEKEIIIIDKCGVLESPFLFLPPKHITQAKIQTLQKKC